MGSDISVSLMSRLIDHFNELSDDKVIEIMGIINDVDSKFSNGRLTEDEYEEISAKIDELISLSLNNDDAIEM